MNYNKSTKNIWRCFMRRVKRFISTILMGLILCVCFLFGGCSEEGIAGTYKFSKMTYVEYGVQVEIEAGKEYMGMMTISEDYITLTLNEDGTAVFKMTEGEETEMNTGTWEKMDGETIKVTFNGESETYKYSENTITVEEEDGTKIILKK